MTATSILLWIVVQDVADPSREADIDTWYRDIWTPNMLRQGANSVIRYRNPRPDVTKGRPQSLTVADLRAGAQPVASHRDAILQLSGAYRSLGTTGHLPRDTDASGLLVGLTDAVAGREEEFNLWYDTVHAAEVVESGLYVNARRFRLEAGTGSPSAPEYLALYETYGAEPDVFRQFAGRPNPSPMSDACIVRHVWTFNRLSATVGTKAAA